MRQENKNIKSSANKQKETELVKISIEFFDNTKKTLLINDLDVAEKIYNDFSVELLNGIRKDIRSIQIDRLGTFTNHILEISGNINI